MEELESKWKCSNCGNVYSAGELLSLPKVPVNPDDPDPEKGAGYTPVCTCGKRFFLDKWRIADEVNIKKGRKLNIRLLVSTVALEVEHPSGMWYETMIFQRRSGKIEIANNPMWRYKTQKEAEEGHKKIVQKLKKGRYRLTPKAYRLDVLCR